MVIQCPECQTRFKMADEKAKAGAKVRCSRCKHIFPVQAPSPAKPSSAPLEHPVAPAGIKADTTRGLQPPPSTAAAGYTPEIPRDNTGSDELDLGDFNMEDRSANDSKPALPAERGGDFDFDDFSIEPPTATFSQTAAEAGNFEDLEAGNSDTDEAVADQMPAAEDSPAGEFAFSSQRTTKDDIGYSFDETPADAFDFSEQATGADEFEISAADSSESEDHDASKADADGVIGDPFSFDGPTESSETDDFSFTPEAEEFSFGDMSADAAFSMEESSSAETEDIPAFAGGEGIWNAGDGPNEDFSFTEEEQDNSGADFDFSNMTFGEDSPATADIAPALREMPAAPPAPAAIAPPEQKKERAVADSEDEPLAAPPVRSGKGPISGILAFALVLLVLLCAAAGYFYLQGGLPEIAPLIARITGEAQTPPAVAGQIRVADLNGFFVDNTEAGQLFVIQGRAINEFSEARSAIAVKGVLYNKAGKPLLQQTVYSGNMLSEDTLRSLPFGKIEESMNNQFGDSLSNLNIAPGKSIPFTIVFRNLPDGLAEFTAEVTDSKPGAG